MGQCPSAPHPGHPHTQQHGLGTALAQDGLEDTQERLGQLLLQVVLSVDGQAVLQHEQGVLQAQQQQGHTRAERWRDWGLLQQDARVKGTEATESPPVMTGTMVRGGHWAQR